jgi:hypothetical protein
MNDNIFVYKTMTDRQASRKINYSNAVPNHAHKQKKVRKDEKIRNAQQSQRFPLKVINVRVMAP